LLEAEQDAALCRHQGDHDRDQDRRRRVRGQALCGGRRRDHERQHQEHADHLDRLGRREREQHEGEHRQRSQGHPPRLGDLGIDAREEQRAVGRGDAGQYDHRDHHELVQLAVAHADDAPEEQVRGLGRVALVQAQEQHPHSQPERQHGADRAVALAPAQRQEAQDDADHE